MTLPEDYLRYPNRRHGMDHDRYEWSNLFRRNPVSWPGGAKVALWVCPALEWFPLDMQNKPFRPPGGLERPYPDYRYYTHRDYGNRVGIFRIMKVLDKLGIKASATVNSAVAERYPFLLREVTRRGWEVIAHGVDMAHLHYGGMPEAEEAAQIAQAVTTLRELSGQPVTGWLSPGKSESHATLDLLAAEGIEYVCDWINDDMPYPLKTGQGSLYSMPHSHEIDDRLILLQYHHSERDFTEQVKDQFDTLYKEADKYGGRILSITLHPWVIGQPYRIKPLEEALSYIMGHKDVWCATGSEILAAFKASQ
ncbi:MAG: polysaccharide deacetylase family protein [SAR324 cluster bacterium]|nr:polysaccharide deacetylase family protein [SAR324 cluster bacterium]MCH8886854.1 polysaccharide deacetylase family protein [SAR324 cluster bacterium]